MEEKKKSQKEIKTTTLEIMFDFTKTKVIPAFQEEKDLVRETKAWIEKINVNTLLTKRLKAQN